MGQKEELQSFAIRECEVLHEAHGYSKPVVSEEQWLTRILLAKGDVGIEVELDWRELRAFLLLVRLDRGRLPRGYYVADGRKCRQHLANVIRARKWPLGAAAALEARSRRDWAATDMRAEVLSHKRVLLAYLAKIEDEWHSLWQHR